ncbi:MAG: hypothetical protein F2681_10010 [Actinobacteria bacterium]|uniref:Unannotated protein n=1 Tax=freshwater metagenome TaxID=449393 RepID=A0A6J7NH66_9ZZZZ|nr:hypothetical protein [Actinomycetota bacterium]MSW76876.1 hypothetical protein [Actinomycetota bacterium]MSX53997.1 hypothetical protein [Actinomycetota bacterium]MSX92068.1 hypothetical protein [Actinomycetota bacterium]MSZ83466.1 hypothetical protein [Actinomycetota bacterium]
MNPPTPTPGVPPSTTEILAATIAGVVERQLTQYITAMTQQVEAQGQRSEASQHALQTALEGRLAEFAQFQQLRMNEVEERLLGSPMGAALAGSIDAGELIALREHVDAQSAGAHARIDDLSRSARRFDEQTSALVQHVNDTTIALTQRMDDGNQALATAVEERLGFVRTSLEAVGPEVQRQVTEHSVMLTQRIDFAEHKITDRMLAMEDRVNEQTGTKIANLEATLGRIGAGFDEAIVALSQRMLELENGLAESKLQLELMHQKVGSIDEAGIDAVKDQLSSAVGEVMLVRIELDRVVANTDEKVNRATLRMAEIESLLQDEMDVSTTVQLERLDELERAVATLDPSKFAHDISTGPTAEAVAAPSTNSLADVTAPLLRPSSAQMPSTSLGDPAPITPPHGSPTTSTEASLSSF